MNEPAFSRGAGLCAVFAALLALPFLGKPFHVDEPFFLAVARHILADPLHPLAFEFNWYGRARPMAELNNTPPLLAYLVAGALKLGGGGEAATRLFFLPFDMLAAASLYGLAARLLKRPLLPVLVLLAGPGFALTMEHLMAEKLMAAFGFGALYMFVCGADDGDRRRLWAASLLLSLALLSKYAAVLFVVPLAAYGFARRLSLRALLLHLGLPFLPLAGWLLLNAGAFSCAWRVTTQSVSLLPSAWSHRLRALLSFAGGTALAAAVWPFLAYRSRGRGFYVLSYGVLLLFIPFFDLAPVVRPFDRALGAALSWGAAWGLLRLLLARGGPERALWGPWAAAAAALCLLYWSVAARLVLFLLPPLVFSAARALEKSWEARRLWRLYAVTLTVSLALTAALAWTDLAYARTQRDIAREIQAAAAGRRVWFAGQWGLKYYMERAGAVPLDAGRGGWEEVRPGDLVLVPTANANILKPARPARARVTARQVDWPVPLRLISAFGGEGGFYSSVTGFLPYSPSLEPLERFALVELEAPYNARLMPSRAPKTSKP